MTVKDIYELAASGLSIKQIDEIAARRARPDRFTAHDVAFLRGCGVRIDPEDVEVLALSSE